MTGLRAILWHQGETDNYLGTSYQNYVSSFTNLLNSVRSKTGKDIPWMVARVSKDPYRYYQTVIDAQNFIIQSNGNVFEGPNTDVILERTDGVHFSGIGLTKAAFAWNASMTDNFFQVTSPQFGNPPLQIEHICSDPKGNAPMQLFAPVGYVSYAWSNGTTKRDIKVGPGSVQGLAKDIYGNVYYSSRITYDNGLYSSKPTIEPLGDTQFCSGKSIELKTNSDFWNYWSNGAEGQSIRVNQSGKYHITHVNIYACSYTSDEIEIKVKPTPKPLITASGPLEICSDESLVLRANQSSKIEWNTGSTLPELTVEDPGFYTLKVTNEEGCVGVSDPIEVKIKPAAVTPIIENIGNDEICDLDSTVIKVSNLQNMKWVDGTTKEEIVVKKAGEYYAINTNEFGCKSSSRKIEIIVRPTPVQPKIIAKGSTEVCDGEKIALTSDEAYEYLWSTGPDTRDVELSKTNAVFLRTSNQFGCISKPSNIKNIFVLERRQNPSIIQTGTFTLSSFFTSDTSNMNYEWRFNDNKLISQQSFIKARESGDYSVRGLKTYKIGGEQVKTCASETSLSLKYHLNQDFDGFSFYPNPTEDGILTIETLEDLENSTISIFNLDGKLKFTQEVDIFNSPKKIDLSFLDYGKYIIQVRNRRNKLIGKLQKD